MTRRLLVVLSLLGAAAAAAPPAQPGFPVSIEDDSGRRVTIAAAPRRIISLAPAHTETLFAIGAADRVVATDRYSDYPAAARGKKQLNTWPRPPLEPIVALKPDLVVVLTEGDDFIREMDAVHIPVLKLFPATFDGALRDIELLGKAVGRAAAARKLAAVMRARTAAVERRVRGAFRTRVMFELDSSDPAQPFVAGSGAFYGQLLELAGGANVFADTKSASARVSLEAVVARNPEVIVLGGARSDRPRPVDTAAKRTGWSSIAAVRNGRVYSLNTDRVTRPGPRLVDGLEDVARVLHPERYRQRGRR